MLMPGNNEYSVMALTGAIVANDASSIEIKLAVVGETPLVLTMSPNSLAQIVSGLTQVDSAVQIQIGSTTGHVAVSADNAQAVMAKEAAGGDKVVLSVRNSRDRFQSFALSLEQSQQLRVEMKKAEARARELASKSRN
jgi:Ethanolamine utilization protein EutJ (predicted chaperonin)